MSRNRTVGSVTFTGRHGSAGGPKFELCALIHCRLLNFFFFLLLWNNVFFCIKGLERDRLLGPAFQHRSYCSTFASERARWIQGQLQCRPLHLPMPRHQRLRRSRRALRLFCGVSMSFCWGTAAVPKLRCACAIEAARVCSFRVF